MNLKVEAKDGPGINTVETFLVKGGLSQVGLSSIGPRHLGLTSRGLLTHECP